MDYSALEPHFPDLDHLFIDLKRLRKEEEYESTPAGFSDVTVCTLDPGTPGAKLVAAKSLTAQDSVEFVRLVVRLARELKVWAALQHPHVLPLLGFHLGQDYGTAILISEYQVNGSLMAYIEEENPSWGIRLQLVRDLTEGLVYLHEQSPPVIHGDLKPQNILISGKRKAMLCDFGLSKYLDASTGLTTTPSVRGTFRYQSPEISMEEVSSPRLSSDVWSWACLALVALTDTSPYDQVKMDIGIVLAMSKGQRPAEVQSLRIPAPHLKQLLTQCWDFEPDGRPSAADCLRIIESALAMVSDFPELDFNLPEKQLQHLQHILIDISRLKEEIRFPSEHIHARICTLDPGTPTSKLVTARTDHFMPERKRTRLALRFARQLEFRAALQHPHILPVLGGYLDRKGMAAVFISEYQAGGDLKKFLEQEKPAWTTRLQLVRDMIDGLCYLHAKAIPHGDLNMGNVVISADRKAMLADFGPSKAPDDSPAELDSDGLDAAARYRSPELADKEENYWDRLPPDIWAWGCLALETLTDTLPYADEEAPTAILDAVLNGKPPAQVENLDISVPDLRLLLSRCWAFEPEARPSARDCRHILDSALTIIPIPAETYLTPLEICLQKFKYLRVDITRLQEEIGYPEMRGGYAQIRVCTLDPGTTASNLVVAKKLNFDPEWKPERLASRLARELRIWAVLQHPHILPLLGFYLDQDHKIAILIAEYQAQGDLAEYIRKENPIWNIRLQLVRDLTDGLVYLHGQTPPIRHGDLKTGNIFISAEGKALLADFGISKSLENGPTGLSSDGRDATLRYCSPELADEQGTGWSELSSDIWAWGCLALEALTDTLPYANKKTRSGLLTAILRGHPPARVEDLPIPIPDIKLLLARCWDSKPYARPLAAECLQTLSSAIL